MWFENTTTVHKPPYPLSFEEFLAYDDESGLRYELLDTGELTEWSLPLSMDLLQAKTLSNVSSG